MNKPCNRIWAPTEWPLVLLMKTLACNAVTLLVKPWNAFILNLYHGFLMYESDHVLGDISIDSCLSSMLFSIVLSQFLNG